MSFDIATTLIVTGDKKELAQFHKEFLRSQIYHDSTKFELLSDKEYEKAYWYEHDFFRKEHIIEETHPEYSIYEDTEDIQWFSKKYPTLLFYYDILNLIIEVENEGFIQNSETIKYVNTTFNELFETKNENVYPPYVRLRDNKYLFENNKSVILKGAKDLKIELLKKKLNNTENENDIIL